MLGQPNGTQYIFDTLNISIIIFIALFNTDLVVGK